MHKRLYISKSEINPYDKYNHYIGFIYGHFESVGTKQFEAKYFNVISNRTGNVSRKIVADVIEIEGLSPLCYMLFTDKAVRKCESLVDIDTKEKYEIQPIGRTKVFNYILCYLKKTGEHI